MSKNFANIYFYFLKAYFFFIFFAQYDIRKRATATEARFARLCGGRASSFSGILFIFFFFARGSKQFMLVTCLDCKGR